MKYSLVVFCVVVFSSLSGTVWAHGVDSQAQYFLENITGTALGPFFYMGAKHMVTGYDHLLFLLGVIFFLFKTRDIVVYVSLFTLGHSITLLLGVLENIQVNAYLIDAIIGLSVVYKGFDNLGGFKRCFGFQPNTKWAVLIFGLFHGFGLATKLQEFSIPEQGLWQNLLAFNLGVEAGQCVALFCVWLLLSLWRRFKSYFTFAVLSNTFVMLAGFLLFGYQMLGFSVVI